MYFACHIPNRAQGDVTIAMSKSTTNLTFLYENPNEHTFKIPLCQALFTKGKVDQVCSVPFTLQVLIFYLNLSVIQNNNLMVTQPHAITK